MLLIQNTVIFTNKRAIKKCRYGGERFYHTIFTIAYNKENTYSVKRGEANVEQKTTTPQRQGMFRPDSGFWDRAVCRVVVLTQAYFVFRFDYPYLCRHMLSLT